MDHVLVCVVVVFFYILNMSSSLIRLFSSCAWQLNSTQYAARPRWHDKQFNHGSSFSKRRWNPGVKAQLNGTVCPARTDLIITVKVPLQWQPFKSRLSSAPNICVNYLSASEVPQLCGTAPSVCVTHLQWERGNTETWNKHGAWGKRDIFRAFWLAVVEN